MLEFPFLQRISHMNSSLQFFIERFFLHVLKDAQILRSEPLYTEKIEFPTLAVPWPKEMEEILKRYLMERRQPSIEFLIHCSILRTGKRQ